jgi:type II secretory pathway pseudopilin PulG
MAARRRAGFSMVEALAAIAITTVAGGALLVSIAGSVQSSTQVTQSAVARGLAEQLMEEIAATRFPASTNTTPSGSSRVNFNDIDDYHNWTVRPPQDRQGRQIGLEGYSSTGGASTRLPEMRPDSGFLSGLTHAVVVERVQPDSGTGWTVVTSHTNYRRVTVRVAYTNPQSQTVTLASITRIFSYVPITP